MGGTYQQARAYDGLARLRHAEGNPGRGRRRWQQAPGIYAGLGVPEATQGQHRLAMHVAQDQRCREP
jgi:hypothetical protein